MIVTAQHYSRVEVQAEEPRPILPDPPRQPRTSCARRGDRSLAKPARTR